jgi:hypothetical protein
MSSCFHIEVGFYYREFTSCCLSKTITCRMNDSRLDLLTSINLQRLSLRYDKAQQWDLMESVRNTESVYRTSATLPN